MLTCILQSSIFVKKNYPNHRDSKMISSNFQTFELFLQNFPNDYTLRVVYKLDVFYFGKNRLEGCWNRSESSLDFNASQYVQCNYYSMFTTYMMLPFNKIFKHATNVSKMLYIISSTK